MDTGSIHVHSIKLINYIDKNLWVSISFMSSLLVTNKELVILSIFASCFWRLGLYKSKIQYFLSKVFLLSFCNNWRLIFFSLKYTWFHINSAALTFFQLYLFYPLILRLFEGFFLHASLLNICKIQHVAGFYFINRICHSLSSSQLSVLIIYYLSWLGICLDLNKMDVIFCIVFSCF